MKSAPMHPNEEARLAALRHLNILDSLPTQDFDDITRIASQVCGAPIALVSLIDESRQWFLSKAGIEAVQTPRDLAFCAHAILEDGVFIVPDATKDERFHDNPLVVGGPKAVFYAGAPLISPDGFPIGTLCVIDHEPRQLSPDQIIALNALANQLHRLLELRCRMEQRESELTAQVTLRKEIEKKQRDLKKVLNGVPAMIGHWSADLINLNSNTAYASHFGKTPEQIKGVKMIDLLGAALFETISEEVKSALAGKTRVFETELRKLDATVKHVLVNYIPDLENGLVTGLFVIVSDVSELKKLEGERQVMAARLVESSKLSTLGEMAGGVAHEINTPLAVICAKTSMLLQALQAENLKPAEAVLQLQKIKMTADRIAKIVKGLRLFSRNSTNDPLERVSVCTVLDLTLNLCTEKLLQKNIELKTEWGEKMEISARSTELSQVIMNLISNAIDAVKNDEVKWIEIKTYRQGDCAVISVTDSGFGILPAVVEKMMNPFFTTKDVGQGTGLGLSISKGIVASHNGSLFYDDKSKHTRFVLEIPMAISVINAEAS